MKTIPLNSLSYHKTGLVWTVTTYLCFCWSYCLTRFKKKSLDFIVACVAPSIEITEIGRVNVVFIEFMNSVIVIGKLYHESNSWFSVACRLFPYLNFNHQTLHEGFVNILILNKIFWRSVPALFKYKGLRRQNVVGDIIKTCEFSLQNNIFYDCSFLIEFSKVGLM